MMKLANLLNKLSLGGVCLSSLVLCSAVFGATVHTIVTNKSSYNISCTGPLAGTVFDWTPNSGYLKGVLSCNIPDKPFNEGGHSGGIDADCKANGDCILIGYKYLNRREVIAKSVKHCSSNPGAIINIHITATDWEPGFRESLGLSATQKAAAINMKPVRLDYSIHCTEMLVPLAKSLISTLAAI